jgi:hypothetical protein
VTVPFDLSRLGSDRFEHLVQALTIDALGHGVQVFGAGPDGGREATFDGPVQLDGKPAWDGYGVIQAKYKSTLYGPELDQQWFFSELTKELDKWKNSNRREPKPQYFVLVTNVPLSAVARDGGLDRFQRLMLRYQKEGLTRLEDWDVWAGERVCRMLERSDGIRRSYADLVLPGDVIARLHDMLAERDTSVTQALIGYLARTVAADRSVELGESGDSANTPLSLSDVAVDLPVEQEDAQAIERLVGMAENVLTPDLNPRAFNRVVLLGGPGSGKSTLSRLLAQIYRTAMLNSVAADRITENRPPSRRLFDGAWSRRISDTDSEPDSDQGRAQQVRRRNQRRVGPNTASAHHRPDQRTMVGAA